MSSFSEQVFIAVADGKNTGRRRPEYLANEQRLATALDRMCPEQRCDAIDADWLLHLDNSTRRVELQTDDPLGGGNAIARK